MGKAKPVMREMPVKKVLNKGKTKQKDGDFSFVEPGDKVWVKSYTRTVKRRDNETVAPGGYWRTHNPRGPDKTKRFTDADFFNSVGLPGKEKPTKPKKEKPTLVRRTYETIPMLG
jgi:hypothetical protein